MVAVRYAFDRREKATKVTHELLAEFPELKAVFSTSDNMALGVEEALSQRPPGASPVMVVGFGGTPSALEAIRAGTLAATVYYDWKELVTLSLKAARELILEQPTSKMVHARLELITKAEVSEIPAETAGINQNP